MAQFIFTAVPIGLHSLKKKLRLRAVAVGIQVRVDFLTHLTVKCREVFLIGSHEAIHLLVPLCQQDALFSSAALGNTGAEFLVQFALDGRQKNIALFCHLFPDEVDFMLDAQRAVPGEKRPVFETAELLLVLVFQIFTGAEFQFVPNRNQFLNTRAQRGDFPQQALGIFFKHDSPSFDIIISS